jgi:hypothetical protein
VNMWDCVAPANVAIWEYGSPVRLICVVSPKRLRKARKRAGQAEGALGGLFQFIN